MSRIGDLTNKLFPTGFAFKTVKGGVKEKLIEGLAISEQQAYDDARSILDSTIPDNTNFTASDATRYEQYLGIITNPLVPIQDRRDAIIRKLNHPGDILARQSADYIQRQLVLAGFNVTVHETTQSIESLGGTGGSVQAGDAQAGDTQFGHILYDNKIVNSLDATVDKLFMEDSLNRVTFVISGAVLGAPVNILASREKEFRQTLLRLKPAQTVCYAFINYI